MSGFWDLARQGAKRVLLGDKSLIFITTKPTYLVFLTPVLLFQNMSDSYFTGGLWLVDGDCAEDLCSRK